ncbi:hypothetical protein GOFOIKOB_5780 [Methylobacterium tardum]|uniref:HIRAN domain-containing protein n=1 Tax=Methylobacterium tardum TaxID=374432 RepID=A0AA37WPH1_9HYPH|nr:HIRAN domain-containing protein [Methylobacterium tardum]URD39572.1 HIRAN domain-containing protein [Methylobacterium tardum]GJE52706.1 hypothetical protein GOFOIKOB_5780 [Methylobacterium tardum]GLS68154.1 hypothetical protein GCM10007890_01660 [Methylobacterium tardum]
MDDIYEPTLEDQYDEFCLDQEYERELASAIAKVREHGLDLQGVRYTPLGREAIEIANGQPWCQTELAGLQFYDYAVWDEDLGRHVLPQPGDYLNLVRAPDNEYDKNAVEVWWRNVVRLGHLPRAVAKVVAEPLDRGEHCVAFVGDGGTGEAWTAKAVLIGEAVRELHERRIRHAIDDGIRQHIWRERDNENRLRAIGWLNGKRFREEQEADRKRRLVQAVNALLPGEPFEIEPPAVGACIELFAIETLLDVSRSTAARICQRAACPPEVDRRGWYATGSFVVVTPRLQQALRDWAAHPIRRITHEDVRLGSDSIVAPPNRDDPDDIPF